MDEVRDAIRDISEEIKTLGEQGRWDPWLLVAFSGAAGICYREDYPTLVISFAAALVYVVARLYERSASRRRLEDRIWHLHYYGWVLSRTELLQGQIERLGGKHIQNQKVFR